MPYRDDNDEHECGCVRVPDFLALPGLFFVVPVFHSSSLVEGFGHQVLTGPVLVGQEFPSLLVSLVHGGKQEDVQDHQGPARNKVDE